MFGTARQRILQLMLVMPESLGLRSRTIPAKCMTIEWLARAEHLLAFERQSVVLAPATRVNILQLARCGSPFTTCLEPERPSCSGLSDTPDTHDARLRRLKRAASQKTLGKRLATSPEQRGSCGRRLARADRLHETHETHETQHENQGRSKLAGRSNVRGLEDVTKQPSTLPLRLHADRVPDKRSGVPGLSSGKCKTHVW